MLENSDNITDCIWKSTNNRVTIYQCSVLHSSLAADLTGCIDLIYDKDAFGAIPLNIRENYLNQLDSLLKSSAYILLQVKDKRHGDARAGPPFHFSPALIDAYWGTDDNESEEEKEKMALVEGIRPLGYTRLGYNPCVIPLGTCM